MMPMVAKSVRPKKRVICAVISDFILRLLCIINVMLNAPALKFLSGFSAESCAAGSIFCASFIVLEGGVGHGSKVLSATASKRFGKNRN